LLALEKRCLELLSEEEETTPVVWEGISFEVRRGEMSTPRASEEMA